MRVRSIDPSRESPMYLFDNLRPGAPFELAPVTITGFHELVTELFFGREQPASSSFTGPFVEAFAEALDLTNVISIALFVPTGFERATALYFLADRRVGGASIQVDANLRAWLEALAQPFGGAGAELQFTRTSTTSALPVGGMSVSPIRDAAAQLATDPAAVALNRAPVDYKKRELSEEKAAYLVATVASAAETFDTADLARSLKAFLDARGQKPRKTTTRKKLAGLERAMGTPVPKGLQQLYETLDGARDLFFGFDLMTLEAAVAQRNQWAWTFDDWSLEDLLADKSADRGVLPVYCCPRWVPFVDLVGGHYIAVDAAPAEGGSYGQVILAGRDIHHTRLLAPSLAAFFEGCLGYDGSRHHPLWSVFGELVL